MKNNDIVVIRHYICILTLIYIVFFFITNYYLSSLSFLKISSIKRTHSSVSVICANISVRRKSNLPHTNNGDMCLLFNLFYVIEVIVIRVELKSRRTIVTNVRGDVVVW